MTIIELKDEKKALDEKIATLIKEFESKCKIAAVSSINLERWNSVNSSKDVIAVDTNVYLKEV